MSISRLWKRILAVLATGSTTLFIAGCYGMPSTYPIMERLKLKTVKKSDNTPIPGLSVTIFQEVGGKIDTLYRNEITDSTGKVERDFEVVSGQTQTVRALIHDGSGTFSDTIVTRTGEAVDTVKLTPKQ